jgi:hypothetical protein
MMMQLAIEHPGEFWFLRQDQAPAENGVSDPNLDRKRAIEGIIHTERGKLVDKLEVATRENLSKEYEQRFTLAQLEDLISFSKTPTGAAFAHQNWDMIRKASPGWDALTKAGDSFDRISDEARAALRKLGPATVDDQP